MSPDLSPQFRSIFLQEFEPLCKLAYNLTSDFPASRKIVLEIFVHVWNNQTAADATYPDTDDLQKKVIQSCYAFLAERKTTTDAFSEITSHVGHFNPDGNQSEPEKALIRAIDELPPCPG